jgi:hypothetical protein
MLHYKIAEHSIRVSFSEGTFPPAMDNYAPFRTENYNDVPLLFDLQITENLEKKDGYILLKRFNDDVANISVCGLPDEGYRFTISPPNGEDCCIMETNPTFSQAKAQLIGKSNWRFFGLNNALMMLYAFASAPHNTLLIHAAVIKNKDEGFVFLGKSGTGKSTHSRLWLENISDSELLNDDNPVIRITDGGEATIYGSPWSGKTPCYHNESVPIKGIVKLQQAPENKIERLSHLQAYAVILPACSCMKWENEIMEGVHQTVEKLATNTACWKLACLPNKAAAEMCYETIK